MKQGMRVSVRLADETVKDNLEIEKLPLFKPEELMPWRTPTSYQWQEHMPGFFWLSSTRQLLSYESRLEMCILKRLDFEEPLAHGLPQPFMLTYFDGTTERQHIPDFLCWRNGIPRLLVNVKPLVYVAKPKNRNAFNACDALAERLGWRHTVYSEPEPIFFANLKWLAGYRRAPFAFEQLRPVLESRLSSGPIEFATWIRGVADDALVRPAAFHMMWKQQAHFERSRLLCDRTLVAGRIASETLRGAL